MGLPVSGNAKVIAAESGRTQEIAEVTQALTNQEQKQELAERLLNQGLEQDRLDRFQEALQSFEASLALFRELGDHVGERAVLDEVAASYVFRRKYAQALDFYQQSLAVSREVDDRTGERSSLYSIGRVYYYQGKYADELDYYRQALAVSRETGDHAGEREILNEIAAGYSLKREYAQALDFYQQALAVSREVGDRSWERLSLTDIGKTYYYQGKSAQALDFLRQALIVAREIDDRVGERIALDHIGAAYSDQGQHAQALDFYQQSLAVSRETGDRAAEGTTLNNIGTVYNVRAQYAQALDHYQQAWAIHREVNDRGGSAVALGNIGGVYSSQGQYAEALNYYQKALALRRRIVDLDGEGNVLSNIGVIYHSQGQYAEALDYFQRALAIRRELGDRLGSATALNNIGGAYDSQGRYAEALDYTQQALAIDREVGNRGGEGQSLHNIGAHYNRLDQHAQALDYFQQALPIRREMGDRSGESTTLNSIGRAYGGQGKFAEASKYFRRSIAILEAIERDAVATDQSRVSLFETRASTYSRLEWSLAAQGKFAESLEIADRSRARSLVQFLNPSTDNKPRKSLNIRRIKRLARKKNATLITYSIVKEELYIWVVSPSGDLNFVKTDLEQAGIPLRQVIKGSRSAASLGRFNNDLFAEEEYRIDLQALQAIRSDGSNVLWAQSPEYLERGYNLLIKPIEDDLPDPPGSRLIIVPHRELSTVPFAALFKEDQGFLIDRYTLTVTPSLQTLDTLQQTTPTATGTPLIVGNPSPMVDNLSPLPRTEAEAIAIAQKLNVTPILGKQATEANLKPKFANASILHLATHGVIQKSDRDLNSWLALADISSNSDEDNKLTISEIFNSNFNAQLAVLSACNTNSGEISGEGVVGLARAFLKAGVPTVVASSWKVPDRETQILMEEFYDQLLAGQTYAEALRIAQLKLRTDYPNPFYWAAFSVIGEGDRTLELP